MFTDILQRLGLPKNEAKIYETLLEKGKLNVSSIAGHAKINRRNVYDSLKNLTNRRLVYEIFDAPHRTYAAVDPQDLEALLRTKKERVRSILPELTKLYKEQRPKEQVYISRGTEGMKNFWRFVVSQTEPTYYIGGKGAWHDPLINEERKEFFVQTQARGIKIYGIFDHEMRERGRDIISAYDPALTRIFPKDYSTRSSVDICNDRILFFNVHERDITGSTIFTLISRPLADAHRRWFQYLWDHAEPL
jgi:sugar-specific transcriptional regulator TrmB